MPKSLKDFFLRFVSVVDKGDNPEADIVMFKQEGGGVMKTLDEILKGLSEEDAKIVTDEIEKTKTDAKADVDALVEKAKTDAKAEFDAEVEKVKKEEEDKKPQGTASFDDTENIMKSADPKVVELIEKMKAEKEQVEKENKETVEKLNKMQEEVKKEQIMKTISQFDRINATQDEMVDIWKSLDSDSEVKLTAIFKAVNEQLTQANIIKTVGSDNDASTENASEQIEKLAGEIKKNEGITIEQARTKVYKTRPDLLKKYREEQKGV